MNKNQIHCLKCIHYYSTHEPQTPRGCKLYGFKTQNIPAIVVKKQTGSECLGFELRQIKNKKASFHDKKYW